MKGELQQFRGIVSGYSLVMLANRETLQFHYYQGHDPDVIFEVIFHRAVDGSTSLDAAQQILKQFNSNFKKCLNYVRNYHEDHKRVEIVDGHFSLWVFNTKIKTKKAVLISFQGRRMMSRKQLQQEKQVHFEVSDVQAQNAYLRETVRMLQQKCQKQAKMIQDLRQIAKMLQQEGQWELLSQDQILSKINQYFHSMKESLKTLMVKTEHHPPHQLPPSPDVDQYDFDSLEKYGMRHWVLIDTNNPHLQQNFVVEGNVLRKIEKYNKFQVLGRDPFPTTGRHFFSLYLSRISYSIFSVGVVNQKRRNYSHSYESIECISFFARDGCVWQGGVSRGGGSPLRGEGQIRVVLDWLKGLVKWYWEGKEVASTTIGANLLGKRIVPYIMINYPGDNVLLNERPAELNGVKLTQ